MYNHPVSNVKRAARRVLNEYFFRCVLASFLSGILVSLVFNYVLDGTLQVESAFDAEAFYKAVYEAENPAEILKYLQNSISALIRSVGYDAYSALLRRFALAIAVSYLIRQIYRIFVTLPFEVGNCRFYIDAHYTEPKYRQLLHGFAVNYPNVVKIQFLRVLKVTLYSLLLFIPGVIKSYETFMIPYLLAENPNLNAREAFRTSRRMMEGNKLNVFLLNLSFIGWIFLSTVTGGLAYIIFVGPYYDAALANMALRIKSQCREDTVSA